MKIMDITQFRTRKSYFTARFKYLQYNIAKIDWERIKPFTI